MGLPSSKQKHLGRNMGAKMLEMQELDPESIRQLGNWSLTVRDKSYSTQMPMPAIRAAAGYVKASGLYNNPRCGLIVEATPLLLNTPFSKFLDVKNFLEGIFSDEERGPKPYTALQFARLMVELNQVLLQDAAAMLVLHPERGEHPFFRLACFHMPEFQVSQKFSIFTFFFYFTNYFRFYFRTSRTKCANN